MENTQKPDYESVLADLEAKKVAIENAITYLKQAMGISVASSPVNGDTPALNPAGTALEPKQTVSLRTDEFFNMRVPAAIKKYLGMVKRPASTNEIMDALKQGGLTSSSENFYPIVYTALKRMKDTEIEKVGDNWGLSIWYPGKNRKPKTEEIKGAQEWGLFAHLFFAASLAIWRLLSGLKASFLAIPPFNPPLRPMWAMNFEIWDFEKLSGFNGILFILLDYGTQHYRSSINPTPNTGN